MTYHTSVSEYIRLDYPLTSSIQINSCSIPSIICEFRNKNWQIRSIATFHWNAITSWIFYMVVKIFMESDWRYFRQRFMCRPYWRRREMPTKNVGEIICWWKKRSCWKKGNESVGCDSVTCIVSSWQPRRCFTICDEDKSMWELPEIIWTGNISPMLSTLKSSHSLDSGTKERDLYESAILRQC